MQDSARAAQQAIRSSNEAGVLLAESVATKALNASVNATLAMARFAIYQSIRTVVAGINAHYDRFNITLRTMSRAITSYRLDLRTWTGLISAQLIGEQLRAALGGGDVLPLIGIFGPDLQPLPGKRCLSADYALTSTKIVPCVPLN